MVYINFYIFVVFLFFIQDSSPASVPYALAVRNSRTLIASSDTSETLKEQVLNA